MTWKNVFNVKIYYIGLDWILTKIKLIRSDKNG